MMAYRILIVDDEPANLEPLARIFRSDGAEVELFQDPRRALDALGRFRPDVLLTDLRMHGISGMELLDAVKHVDPSVEIIVATAYGTVEIAVEAMKKGAYDFVTKPIQRMQVLGAVHRALERGRLVHENASLKDELKSHHDTEYRDVLGKSPEARRMIEVARQAACSRAHVLIDGESGTGKGLLAKYIHEHSEVPGLLVTINCTAVPENLLEAELFGYERGAFTGATRRKKGRVELAHGGTLFLDEIGIAPLSLQAKLLRFLQDGEFERLGAMETLRVETRVISATNSDLKRAIRDGAMREDLYYRLNVVQITVPPLRDRKEDIPLLARKFLEESAKKNGRVAPLLHPDALDRLVEYPFPGNIRELQNLTERMVVLNTSGTVGVDDLPAEIGGRSTPQPRSIVVPVGTSLREVERLVVDETLRCTRGDKKLAAKLLGVHWRTVYRHLEGAAADLAMEQPLPESPPASEGEKAA